MDTVNTVNRETVEVGQYVATDGKYLGKVISVNDPDDKRFSTTDSTVVRTDAGYKLTLWGHTKLDLTEWQPTYEKWRHGGWYVTNVRYPSGAVGCVTRNYADKKWRIACDPREGSYPGGPNDHTYPNRDAAARAERELTLVST